MSAWDSVDTDELARAWIAELSGSSSSDDLSLKVVEMNFFASAETQWKFLQAAVCGAETDEHLAAIAAGPLEHLLGHHGEYIAEVERASSADPKFARMTEDAWQNQMSGDVWGRLLAITGRTPDE